jgi:hypothetical protein
MAREEYKRLSDNYRIGNNILIEGGGVLRKTGKQMLIINGLLIVFCWIYFSSGIVYLLRFY